MTPTHDGPISLLLQCAGNARSCCTATSAAEKDDKPIVPDESEKNRKYLYQCATGCFRLSY